MASLDGTLKMPSGIVLRNRLVKTAMAESMADSNNPGDRYISAYSKYSSGGWGALVTGNVDVSTVYMGDNNNIAIKPSGDKTSKDSWKTWALAAQADGTPVIIQLVHQGRQAPANAGSRSFFQKSIAPSPIGLNLGTSFTDKFLARVLFGTPREMTTADIDEVVKQFATAAEQVYKAGFAGIQLHGAHGYLLSQFLSPTINLRTDAYGGTPAKRARIVVDILHAIHAVVPPTFSVSIKINSADVGGSESLEDALEQIGLIAAAGIDFMEISGGTYEKLRMSVGDEVFEKQPRSERTAKREAFFLDFAAQVRQKFLNLMLMVTGGFRTRQGMQVALDENATDLIGIGRPAAVWPHLPKDLLLNKAVNDEDATLHLVRFSLPTWAQPFAGTTINGSADTMYYNQQIKNLGVGKRTAPPAGTVTPATLVKA